MYIVFYPTYASAETETADFNLLPSDLFGSFNPKKGDEAKGIMHLLLSAFKNELRIYDIGTDSHSTRFPSLGDFVQDLNDDDDVVNEKYCVYIDLDEQAMYGLCSCYEADYAVVKSDGEVLTFDDGEMVTFGLIEDAINDTLSDEKILCLFTEYGDGGAEVHVYDIRLPKKLGSFNIDIAQGDDLGWKKSVKPKLSELLESVKKS